MTHWAFVDMDALAYVLSLLRLQLLPLWGDGLGRWRHHSWLWFLPDATDTLHWLRVSWGRRSTRDVICGSSCLPILHLRTGNHRVNEVVRLFDNYTRRLLIIPTNAVLKKVRIVVNNGISLTFQLMSTGYSETGYRVISNLYYVIQDWNLKGKVF